MDDAYTVKVTALESGEETPEQLQALKAGDCFLVADGWGDMRDGAEGFFDNDTRILSRLVMRVGQVRPSRLSSGVSGSSNTNRSGRLRSMRPPCGRRLT